MVFVSPLPDYISEHKGGRNVRQSGVDGVINWMEVQGGFDTFSAPKSRPRG